MLVWSSNYPQFFEHGKHNSHMMDVAIRTKRIQIQNGFTLSVSELEPLRYAIQYVLCRQFYKSNFKVAWDIYWYSCELKYIVI